MLSAEKIQENWENLLELVSKSFSWEKEKIVFDFLNKYEDRLALMPASGKTSYHNAFPGGYVDHVLRVWSLAFQVKELWEKNRADINFTDEELATVVFFHDLGKFGDYNQEYYLQNTSEWHVKNKGEVYMHNPSLSFMKVSDRSLFLAQSLGLRLTENEYLGIKLHDGLYEEGNKSYLISYSPEYALQSNLAHIVHQADMAASKIEQGLISPKKGLKNDSRTKAAVKKKSSHAKLLNQL
jgi:hypothetical protein